MNVQAFNQALNHPAVHPFVCMEPGQALDVSPLLQDGKSVVISDETGGFFYHHIGPGLYQVHTAIVPEGRGFKAFRRARASVDWMFTHTDATEIYTAVAEDNTPAQRLAEACGFVFWFSRPDGVHINGQYKPAGFYKLSILDWAQGFSPQNGRDFHRMLDDAKKAAGVAELQHEDDEAHDRAVGACIEMALSGQPGKAEVVYNRWALVAGYAPCEVVSQNPLVIDIQECVINVTHDKVEVVQCP